jgi:hypothetical protein
MDPRGTQPNDGWHSKQPRWLLSKKAAADADMLGRLNLTKRAPAADLHDLRLRDGERVAPAFGDDAVDLGQGR